MKTNNQYFKIAAIFIAFAILMGLLYYIGKNKHPKKFSIIPKETVDELSRLSNQSDYCLHIPKMALSWDNANDIGMDIDLSSIFGGDIDDLKLNIPGFLDPDRLELDPYLDELGELAKAVITTLDSLSYGIDMDGLPFGDPYETTEPTQSEALNGNPYGTGAENPYRPALQIEESTATATVPEQGLSNKSSSGVDTAAEDTPMQETSKIVDDQLAATVATSSTGVTTTVTTGTATSSTGASTSAPTGAANSSTGGSSSATTGAATSSTGGSTMATTVTATSSAEVSSGPNDDNIAQTEDIPSGVGDNSSGLEYVVVESHNDQKVTLREAWDDLMSGSIEIPGRATTEIKNSEQPLMSKLVEKGDAELISPGIYYVRRDGKMSYLEDANFIVYFVTDELDIWKECALQTILEAESAIPIIRQVMGKYYYPQDVNGRKLPIYLPCNARAYKALCRSLSPSQEAKMSELSTNVFEINESGCVTKGIIINPRCYADKTLPHNNYKIAIRRGMALYTYFSTLDYANLQHQPLWATEGLADFVAHRSPGKITAKNKVDYIAKNCDIRSEFPKDKNASCWAGESFYKFVADACGAEAVKTLIQKLYDTPMEMALLYVFPDIQSAQDAWIGYLTNQDNYQAEQNI